MKKTPNHDGPSQAAIVALGFVLMLIAPLLLIGALALRFKNAVYEAEKRRTHRRAAKRH